jgi:hypothetical protein
VRPRAPIFRERAIARSALGARAPPFREQSQSIVDLRSPADLLRRQTDEVKELTTIRRQLSRSSAFRARARIRP